MTAIEKGLLEKAQAGGREALGKLLMAHERSCYSLALSLTGNEADAEDVCQDAFSRVARDIRTSGAVHNFRSWLLRIVVCAHRDRLDSEVARRRRERSYAMERNLTEPGNLSSIEQGELRGRLDASLEQLREEYRLPIVLHHRQGLSHSEAAIVLAMPEGTVKTNIHRGLEKLRGLMARAGYACAAPAVVAALRQTPAVSVPASLTAFIKSLVSGAGAKVAATGTAAVSATAGSLALGWKVAAGLSLAAILGAGSFGVWRHLHLAAAPVGAAVPEPVGQPEIPGVRTAEAELAAILAKPASIRLSRESVETWLPEFISRHGFDCARPKDLFTWDTRISVSHKGTVRECLEKLAAASGTKVSFEAGMVRLWRPADPEKLKALVARLASNDEQERCVAVWRLAWLGDPDAVGLVLKPAVEDPSAAVRAWAIRGLERHQRSLDAPPLLPLNPPGLDREKWVRTALASKDQALRRLAAGAAGVWRVLPGGGAPLMARLKDEKENSAVRTTVAWALGRCRFAPAREPLVEVLCGGRAQQMPIRSARAVARAVARLGLGDLPEKLIRQAKESPGAFARTRAIHALGELRWQPAEPAIRKAAEGPGAGWAAVEALREIEQLRARSIADLERAATGKDFWASRSAFRKLEYLDTHEAREALFRLAGKDIHYGGAALIRLGDKRVVKLVLRKAAEGDDDSRWVAIRLIPRLPAKARGPKVVAMLIDALKKPEKSKYQRRRSAAAKALGELGCEVAIPALAKACRDKKFFVSGDAAKSLGKIGTAAVREELLKMLVEKKGPDNK